MHIHNHEPIIISVIIIITFTLDHIGLCPTTSAQTSEVLQTEHSWLQPKWSLTSKYGEEAVKKSKLCKLTNSSIMILHGALQWAPAVKSIPWYTSTPKMETFSAKRLSHRFDLVWKTSFLARRLGLTLIGNISTEKRRWSEVLLQVEVFPQIKWKGTTTVCCYV